ncbi:LysE family translocator [Alteribacillus iranensis]|uniref:Threonine/homoserine/homoserine lactone efflux protein n=1 Tax=Alteribacillus iranensis TaxID=930128 RepID=A0A1I2BT99_9BACI|nr:LysE family translocator [Alteribacillus iranensis]SFE59128.1 Threonine/homoserine/homoserine lactone efflux protein [Alteribacillus iranensis]
MLDLQSFGLFIIAALTLLTIPGPSVLYVIARSVDQGRQAGMASVLGNAFGSALLAVAAALGLTAILASSEIAFHLVKYVGAAYLVYLGISRFFSKEEAATAVTAPRERLSRIFTQGAIVAALNPKTALFFLAFVPQFVDASQGGIWEQTLFLGMMLILLGIVTDSIYALLAGTAGNWLTKHGLISGKMNRNLTSGIYLALGILFALMDPGKR